MWNVSWSGRKLIKGTIKMAQHDAEPFKYKS